MRMCVFIKREQYIKILNFTPAVGTVVLHEKHQYIVISSQDKCRAGADM